MNSKHLLATVALVIASAAARRLRAREAAGVAASGLE